MKKLHVIYAFLLVITIAVTASADSIQSAFQPVTLDGAAGPGMIGTAHV